MTDDDEAVCEINSQIPVGDGDVSVLSRVLDAIHALRGDDVIDDAAAKKPVNRGLGRLRGEDDDDDRPCYRATLT